MNTLRLSLAILAAMLGLALYGAPAEAQPVKVWVSVNGGDSATCGDATSPCATFFQAAFNVAAGGEISVLTPGDYDSVGIGKSLTISNDGAGVARIAVFAGGAVVISAGAGDVVTLRGLVMDGQGSGTAGIQVLRLAALHMQNCVIRNFTPNINDWGILFTPSSRSKLFISDSIIYNNGSGSGGSGLLIAPTGTGSADVVLDRVHVEDNVGGLKVDGTLGTGNGARVVLRDSVISGNIGDGILAISAPGKAPALVYVDQSSSVGNTGNGIRADGARAVVLVNDSTITRNGTGVSTANGGQLISYGNNRNNNNIGPEGTATGLFNQF